MKAIYIRHNCSSTNTILQELWDRRLVALHYHDDFSTNPDDYSQQGQKALSKMWSYCESGAIVGADFRKLTTSKMLVGEIAPGSEIKGEQFVDPVTQESFIYKVVQLTNSKEIDYVDFPLLIGVQPRLQALTPWPSGQQVLESAMYGIPIPLDPANLHPSLLEVLCYEWMKTKGLIDRLVLPIGRGMIDVDVVGLDRDGNRVIAQVTHATNRKTLEDKQQRLLDHVTGSTKSYFFLPYGAKLASSQGVRQVGFTQVFDELMALGDPATDSMIRCMLNGFGESNTPHQ